MTREQWELVLRHYFAVERILSGWKYPGGHLDLDHVAWKAVVRLAGRTDPADPATAAVFPARVQRVVFNRLRHEYRLHANRRQNAYPDLARGGTPETDHGLALDLAAAVASLPPKLRRAWDAYADDVPRPGGRRRRGMGGVRTAAGDLGLKPSTFDLHVKQAKDHLRQKLAEYA